MQFYSSEGWELQDQGIAISVSGEDLLSHKQHYIAVSSQVKGDKAIMWDHFYKGISLIYVGSTFMVYSPPKSFYLMRSL